MEDIQLAQTDLEAKVREFLKYTKRINLIDEVILDQLLLVDGWDLRFMVDAYNIYNIAFPRIIAHKERLINNNLHIFLDPISKAERNEIFRQVVRQAIPFFALQRVKAPYLIPSYRKEIETRVNSLYQRYLKTKMSAYYSEHISDTIDSQALKWQETIENLRSSDKNATRRNVEAFYDETEENFYIISFFNSTGLGILKHLLSDKHISVLTQKQRQSLRGVKADVWIDILDALRDKPVSNVYDGMAIAIAKWLNGASKGKKILHYILSDSYYMWQCVAKDQYYRACELRTEYEHYDKKLKKRDYPIVNGVTLNKILKRNHLSMPGVHILRTSEHFEEYALSYDSEIPARIEKLKGRKAQLITDIQIVVPQIAEISSKCTKNPSRCPCAFEVKCKNFQKSLDEFFAKERDITNLINIIDKNNNVFKPLIKFIDDNFNIGDQDFVLPLEPLRKSYTKFFMEQYDDRILEQLRTVLGEFQEELFPQIFSVLNSAFYSKNEARDIRNRLQRFFSINYYKCFKGTKVWPFISKGLQTEGKERSLLWYKDLFKYISKTKSEVDSALIYIILLYCYELYEQSIWLARYWLENNYEDIEKADKRMEFNYMILAARARRLFEYSRDRDIEVRINRVIKDAKLLEEEFGDDPRICYMIGKFHARKVAYEISKDEYDKYESKKYSERALELIDRLPPNEKRGYGDLRNALKNNILYCISLLAEVNSATEKEGDRIAAELKRNSRKAQLVETLASWIRRKAELCRAADPEKSKMLYRKALRKLDRSIEMAKIQEINSQDLRILERQKTRWQEEYKRLYEGAATGVIGA